MVKSTVLFVQGGGRGAHAEDALLASSLRQALGPEYDVRFPLMPHEDDPSLKAWKAALSFELSQIPGATIVAGHSIGGSILLRFLSEEPVAASVTGLFLLAAPSWDPDHWNFEDLKLSRDLANKLAAIPLIFFYHCRDDDVVPFAHLALHAARIPRATFRAIDSGGHQFGNDLRGVAHDIRDCDVA